MAQPTHRYVHPEAVLEAAFARRVRLAGGAVFKTAPVTAGMPDRLVLLPGGRMYLVELKTETGRLRPIQMVWHQRARDLGTEVIVLSGLAQIDHWIRQRMVEIGADVEFPNQGKRWSKAEVETLMSSNESDEDLSLVLGRNPASIATRRRSERVKVSPDNAHADRLARARERQEEGSPS